MEAFIFTLSIFAFWGLIGFSTLTIFDPRLKIIQGVLTAPAVGVAITIIPVYLINRAGFPVKDFGVLLFAALSILATISIAVKRPIFPFPRLIPHLSILLAAGVLVARPMFLYGFNWLSFSNDDMANYCLAAQRFLNHGFFEQPDLDALRGGKDYSLIFWFMHADAGVRSGSELMLSFIWAISGLNAHQIFMPVIVALHLTLVASVGALVAAAKGGSRTTLFAMCLLSLSPLTALGTLYQLIGQVGGLALCVASATLMFKPLSGINAKSLIRMGVSAGLVLVGLLIWYPEILPFFGLGWLLYFSILACQSNKQYKMSLMLALIAGTIVLLILNSSVLTILNFLIDQLGTGTKIVEVQTSLFPYFMLPSGLGVFWGLVPLASGVHEPFASLSIFGGIVLFGWLLFLVMPKQLRNINPSVSVLIVMLGMALLLFFRNNGFGLYKLAMFLQPFLLGSVAIAIGGANWKPITLPVKIAVPLILAAMLVSQFRYVSKSFGDSLGGFNEIPYGSELKINEQFSNMASKIQIPTDESSIFISDTTNVVLAKFQSLYSQKMPMFFLSRDFFFSRIALQLNLSETGRKSAESARQYLDTKINNNNVDVLQKKIIDVANTKYIVSGPNTSIFNRFNFNKSSGDYYFIKNNLKNHLQFLHSRLGNHYYHGERGAIAFYQIENDPMFHGEVFSGIGRHLLFEAINPSEKPRLVVELTDTVLRQFDGALPHANVQGVTLGFVGRGSGRVFSSPLEPTFVEGTPYISIDMGRDGLPFPNNKTGLMLLYGKDVLQDSRLLTAFGRDISLISDDQYLALIPPSALNRFPLDLTNKNLQYSGIYEDGWISETAFFVLTKPSEAKTLVVSGIIPKIIDSDFFTDLTISLNGKTVSVKRLGLGNFKFNIPVVSSKTMNRIDLSFSNYQRLPGEDGRFIGSKLEYLGFE